MMSTANIARVLRGDGWTVEPVGAAITATSKAGMPDGWIRRCVLIESTGGWTVVSVEYRNTFGAVQRVNTRSLRFADALELRTLLSQCGPLSIPVRAAVPA